MRGLWKESAADMQGIIDTLCTKEETEETRRLRTEYGRQRLEIDSLKAELKAYRRKFAEIRASASSSISNADVLEDLKSSITRSLGEMISARFAGIEDRLLPAKTIRPPLAGDRGKACNSAVSSSQPVAPKPIAAAAKRTPPPAQTDTTEVLPLCIPTMQDESWVTVVKKGKKKTQQVVENTAVAMPHSTAVTATTSSNKAQKVRSTLAEPRTAAVIVTLRPEAAEKGVTYAQAMLRAEEAVDLASLGIKDGLKMRRAVTGARVLQLPTTQTSEQADKLAAELRIALDGVANVVCPVKCVDVRVTGLDDSVSTEKLAAAVARAGGCTTEEIRVGDIQVGPRGMGMAKVRCPVTAAKALADAGRVLVGWSSAGIQVLEQLPLRCYRCMQLGHTAYLCPSTVDRSGLCFRCGNTGHKSADCDKPPHCAVCADGGHPSEHVMGGRTCSPPSTRGKTALGTLTVHNTKDHQAREETIVMSS